MEEQNVSLDELLKKIEEFEKTIAGLKQNLENLKVKLIENKKKYGADMSKWPLGAQS